MPNQQFDLRPRIMGQPLPAVSNHSRQDVANYLALSQWNTLDVSLFRNKRADGTPASHLPPGASAEGNFNYDFLTLVIPEGFSHSAYQVGLVNGVVAVSNVQQSGAPLACQFTGYMLANIEDSAQPREWIRPVAINPCELLPSSGGTESHARGNERCIGLATQWSDGQEVFTLFYYAGEIRTNAWTPNGEGLPPTQTEKLFPAQGRYFIPLVLPDNSICYYLVPATAIEAELVLWHTAIKDAGAANEVLMGAIDGPIYHVDDWGICFSDMMRPVWG